MESAVKPISSLTKTWTLSDVLAQPAVTVSLDEPKLVICHRCGEPILGSDEDPTIPHDDHERYCDGPDDPGCTCNLPAHATCCEWCEREDFPDIQTYVLHKMSMENPRVCIPLVNACWVLRTARSSSLPGLRQVWQRIVTDADYMTEIEAALAEVGADLSSIRWDELRGTWYDTAKTLDEAGELSLSVGNEDPQPAPEEMTF